jgi:hypothetical protein
LHERGRRRARLCHGGQCLRQQEPKREAADETVDLRHDRLHFFSMPSTSQNRLVQSTLPEKNIGGRSDPAVEILPHLMRPCAVCAAEIGGRPNQFRLPRRKDRNPAKAGKKSGLLGSPPPPAWRPRHAGGYLRRRQVHEL